MFGKKPERISLSSVIDLCNEGTVIAQSKPVRSPPIIKKPKRASKKQLSVEKTLAKQVVEDIDKLCVDIPWF